MFPNLTRRLPLLVLLLLLTALRATAGDTLVVASRFYHVDRAHNLILINQATAALNTGSPTVKSHLALDHVYAFAHPLQRVATDSTYQAQYAGATYRVYFTQLPIVSIETRYPIVDAPSVYAQLTLVQPSGQTTTSNIGIEIRGASSQGYPKKQYELSFWDDTTGTVDKDVTLLGMRTDNKYNLQAMYNEQLRFRSKVANELWQEVHQIYYRAQEPDAQNGIDAEYVETFINGEYKGIYALSERVDRKQLKLKKYTTEIVGELYEGTDWLGAVTFTSLPPFDNTSTFWGGFEYMHPKEETNWTNLYNFVAFVENSSNADFYAGYRQKFHLGNAVDYYLFLNLIRATDNTGKNIYVARYKKNEPYYYVPWDLDGVFGADWRGDNTGSVDDLLGNGLYDRLNQDCSAGGFRATLAQRWATLRTTVLTESHIMGMFRAKYNYLATNKAYEREALVWPAFQADTTQLGYTAAWLRQRLTFLDSAFSAACTPLAATPRQALPTLQLYPSPAHDYLTVSSEVAPATLSRLTVRDLRGRTVLQTALRGPRNQVSLQALHPGLYVVTVKTAAAVATQKLVVE